MKLAERHVLVETAGGALMLDLASGALLELNESGKVIWQLALAGESEAAIAATLAARHSLELDTARAHVRDTLKASVDGAPEVPQSAFNYERRGAEYVFEFRGEPVFAVDDRGERISLRGEPAGASLQYLLQAVAPKLLALRGQAVLHASAVALGGSAIAFSGMSGAGKTSTARALAAAGARIICEDKLLIQIAEGRTLVAPFAERAVIEWVASTIVDLRASKSSTCAGLDLAVQGELMPLGELGFLDAQRRTPGSFVARALSETEAAGTVFRNAFYGSDSDRDWIRHLSTAVHVARTVDGYALTVPDGLDRLAEAARAFVRAGSLRG